MRWYVNRSGETVGPVDETQVAEWVRGGMTNATVKSEAGGPWFPISGSPFAGFAPTPPVAKWHESPSLRQAAAAVIALTGLGIAAKIVFDRKPEPAPVKKVPEEVMKEARQNAGQPAKPAARITLSDRLMAQSTLLDAVNMVKSELKDTTDDDDPASLMLAVWADSKLDWKDLQTLPSTTYGEAMKDSELERGKRICVSAMVGQIRAKRASEFTYYDGVMGWTNAHRFHAVRSTKGVVENQSARFCGVFTGTSNFTNIQGGQTQAVRLVGMFELPENKRAPTQ
jgi:hypothetical protein